MRAQLTVTNPSSALSTRAEPLVIGSDVPRFTYTALDQPGRMIRLLKLKTAVFRSDPVDCELVHFEIDKAPVYGALSYCWGTDPDDRRILCNGHVFHVCPSLERALKRLRAGFGPDQREAYMWADAVCIDQQNVAEKSEQILLMERIYSNAGTVYVDLGSLEGDTISFGGFGLQFLESSGGLGLQDVLSESDHPAHPFHFKTAFYALTKPWFTRTWIIQEIVLARQAKYIFQGNIFTQHDLDAILNKDAIRANPDRFQELMAARASMRGYLNYQKMQSIKEAYRDGRKDSLLFLQLTRDFVATEPKDKIYGLMALITDDDRAAIGPYSQSVQVVYRRFAALHVHRGRAITMLDSAGIQRRKLAGDPLPSWVPDWTAQSAGPKVISTLRPVPYSASGSLAAHVELLGDAGADGLKLRGLLIDHLESVTDFVEAGSNGDADFMGYHNRIRAAFDSWLRLGLSAYADNEDAFARLLLMDDTYTGRNAILYSSPILDPASTYRTASSSWQAGSSGKMSGQRMSAAQTFQMQAEAACIGRSFAVTRNGHIALVPPLARAGDAVAVFFGATVPYVLRQVQRGFLLVGDAYIHGAMYGEAIPRADLLPVDIVLV